MVKIKTDPSTAQVDLPAHHSMSILTTSSCPIDLQKVEWQPGQMLILREIDWLEFERILSQLDDRAPLRMA
jgi:hypothetical protein